MKEEKVTCDICKCLIKSIVKDGVGKYNGIDPGDGILPWAFDIDETILCPKCFKIYEKIEGGLSQEFNKKLANKIIKEVLRLRKK